MNKKQAYKIVDAYYLFDDLEGSPIDRRKLKRAENKVMPKYNLFLAHNRGAHDAVLGRRVNPFPPGARHEQWAQGNRYV